MIEYEQRCENCNAPHKDRPEGDMADLNNLCRECAAECAAQLVVVIQLPFDSRDEEREAAMRDQDRPWRCPDCGLVHPHLVRRCTRCGTRCRFQVLTGDEPEVFTYSPDPPRYVYRACERCNERAALPEKVYCRTCLEIILDI